MDGSMIKISGVYSITNTVNGKVYIGSSIDISARTYAHKRALSFNRHTNTHLQNSYNKYGQDAFVFKLECETNDDIRDLEFLMIKEMKELGIKMFNICMNTDVNPSSHTEEFKSELAKRNSERVWKEESKRAIGDKAKGRIVSDDTRLKMSEKKIGVKHKPLIRDEEWHKASSERSKITSRARSSMTMEIVNEIRDLHRNRAFSIKQISEMYGISIRQTQRIIRRERWA